MEYYYKKNMSVEKDFPFAELVPKIWITNKYFFFFF